MIILNKFLFNGRYEDQVSVFCVGCPIFSAPFAEQGILFQCSFLVLLLSQLALNVLIPLDLLAILLICASDSDTALLFGLLELCSVF